MVGQGVALLETPPSPHHPACSLSATTAAWGSLEEAGWRARLQHLTQAILLATWLPLWLKPFVDEPTCVICLLFLSSHCIQGSPVEASLEAKGIMV